MLKEEIEQVRSMAREIAKEEIRLAFGDATPPAKQIAKDAAEEATKEAKIAAEEAKEVAKVEKAKK